MRLVRLRAAAAASPAAPSRPRRGKRRPACRTITTSARLTFATAKSIEPGMVGGDELDVEPLRQPAQLDRLPDGLEAQRDDAPPHATCACAEPGGRSRLPASGGPTSAITRRR